MTTHAPRRVLEDGTRVYDNYHRYTPLKPEERKNQVRKPDDPRAVRWRGVWRLPLEVLPDEARSLPETRPDDVAYEHMPRPCKCAVCQRGPAVVGRWQRRWQRDQGLRPKKLSS